MPALHLQIGVRLLDKKRRVIGTLCVARNCGLGLEVALQIGPFVVPTDALPKDFNSWGDCDSWGPKIHLRSRLYRHGARSQTYGAVV
jgi:hypothetical protein